MVKLGMISGPLKYIDVARTTNTSLDVMLEKSIDLMEIETCQMRARFNMIHNVERKNITTLQFGTNLFLCLKQWRYWQQKQQWIKNGRNMKRFRRGTWQKSETNQRCSMKQGRRSLKFILPHWWTSVFWRMPNWRQITKNTKVELYSEETLWKMILDLMQYSPYKDHQHHKWRQQK